jgi:hypothetical protein
VFDVILNKSALSVLSFNVTPLPSVSEVPDKFVNVSVASLLKNEELSMPSNKLLSAAFALIPKYLAFDSLSV